MSVIKDYSPFDPHSNGESPEWKPDTEKFQDKEMDPREMRRRTSIAEGQMKHNKLGWKRLTVRVPPACLLPGLVKLGNG